MENEVKTMNKKSKVFSNIFMTCVIVWLLFPLAATLIYSLFRNWTEIIPQGFSFNSYITVFSNPNFFSALYQTVLLCIVPIIITIIVVLLALFVTTVYFPNLEKYVQMLCMIPYTIQGVILSVSILSVYGKSGGFLGNRMVMLIGAYCIIILPHIYQGIRNSMHAISMTTLIEAAEMLGASRLYAFFKVIVPNIITGITVSSLLAVGILFGDYVIIRNLSGSGTINMQIYLYQAMKRSTDESSAVIVLIMLLTFAITALVLYLQSRSKIEKIQKEGR
ncbi:MAG: ABC transporter permease [Oscillospiraceae bacterium]